MENENWKYEKWSSDAGFLNEFWFWTAIKKRKNDFQQLDWKAVKGSIAN